MSKITVAPRNATTVNTTPVPTNVPPPAPQNVSFTDDQLVSLDDTTAETTLPLELQLRRLQLINAGLKAKGKGKVSLKVSEKGAIQINGIRRFPVVLYGDELDTIFGMEAEIQAFRQANAAEIKARNDAARAARGLKAA